jgi:hypothetical protein
MVSHHLSSTGHILPDRQEEIPPGANGQLDLEGDSSSWQSQGEGLGCTTEPSKAQEPAREGEHCSSNADLSQEAEAGPDHLPTGHPSNCHIVSETMSLRFREWFRSTVLYESI